MEAKEYLLFVCFSFYNIRMERDRLVVQNHKLYKLFMKSLLKSGQFSYNVCVYLRIVN